MQLRNALANCLGIIKTLLVDVIEAVESAVTSLLRQVECRSGEGRWY
jgi:hypothetical protein